MRSSGVPTSISKNIRGTQLLARRPFKVAAVAATDHVIGALGRPSLFDHMTLGLTAHELLQSLFILVLGPASVRRTKKVGQNRHPYVPASNRCPTSDLHSRDLYLPQ